MIALIILITAILGTFAYDKVGRKWSRYIEDI